MPEIELQFNTCAQQLESDGYALLPLSPNLTSSISNSFATARAALDYSSSAIENDSPVECPVPFIDPNSDSGSWTGYHRAAVENGRYNRFREGFVFSNGEMFDINCSSSGENRKATELVSEFGTQMKKLFHIMHDVIANGILQAIERRLQLPKAYFRNELGPTGTSSQWHIKRYDISESKSLGGEILPMHTDPSLISVVILDAPGVQMGGIGLEIYQSDRTWKEISRHGHGIAIIFVGSVLSHLIKDKVMFSAAKHRVVQSWDRNNDKHQRVAATLFVRPNGDALMKPLPSPLFLDLDEKKHTTNQTFAQWNARVAKNYMKKRGQT